MKKFLLLLAAILFLTACQKKDETYYWNHPEALRQQLQECSSQASKSCSTLQAIAYQMQAFTHELQRSPQNFGNKILTLQQQIAQQESRLKQDPNQKALKKELEKNKHLLMQLISIVKQYESPEG